MIPALNEAASLPGVGGALRTAFRYAATHDYDIAIQFDADGQHDAVHLPSLVNELSCAADLVIGSRFAEGDSSYDAGLARGGGVSRSRFPVCANTGRRFTRHVVHRARQVRARTMRAPHLVFRTSICPVAIPLIVVPHATYDISAVAGIYYPPATLFPPCAC